MNKEIELRPHQKRILDLNPDKVLLCWAPRTGKSLPGQLWVTDISRNGNAYVICLKKNKKEWQKRCPNQTVWTKEEFKKYCHTIVDPTAILVDECHYFHAPLFVAKKRSQLAECLYTLIKKYPNMHYMGLSGTPLTNDPASIHTALVYLGKYIPWGQFRDKFYSLEYKPFIPRPAYFPIKNWRGMANELLEKYADIVSLHDCVDYLPAEIKEVVDVKTPKKVFADDDPYHWTKAHKHEQSEKYKYIKELGYRKLILVCHYTEQIDELAKKLRTEKSVYVVDGRTKDQEGTIKKAQEDSDCYLIVQAKMGESWDGHFFDVMVFVSMAHRLIDHTQMMTRLDTVEKQYMKPKIFMYLIGGIWDKRIYDSIMDGENFNVHKYNH